MIEDFQRFGRPLLFFGISAGNLDSIVANYSSNGKVRDFDAYSPNGRRTAVTEPGSSTSFDYDALGRLIQEVRTGPGAYARDYEYDLANNRMQLIADSVTTGYTYDDNDRMLTAGALTFSYDAKGNLTQRTDGVDTTVYGWTPDNRLASVNDGSTAASYLYDADGMRVQKTVGADVTRYLVDPRNPSGYSQVLEETNGTGTLQVGRVFGPLGVLSSNTGGSDLFHLVDGQRSTRLLTDALGAQAAAYTYDGFGNVVSSSGSADTTHRYVGQQSDAESGLQYMRARYYDSAAGRFLSVEPVPGDPRNPATMNRYC